MCKSDNINKQFEYDYKIKSWFIPNKPIYSVDSSVFSNLIDLWQMPTVKTLRKLNNQKRL